jgi:hypothetical protein
MEERGIPPATPDANATSMPLFSSKRKTLQEIVLQKLSGDLPRE